MTERYHPLVGAAVPMGWAQCTKVDFLNPKAGPCGRPAQWHMLWHTVHPVLGAATAIACHEHYHESVERHEMKDSHEFGGACGIPGAVWHMPRDGKPSYCAIPLEDETEEIAQERQHTRETVGASS